MSKLTDFGLPDLRQKKKTSDHPEVTRDKEETLLLGLIEKAKKITATQERDQVQLVIITESGFKAELSNITYPIFKKLYPKVHQALLARGFMPLTE